MVIKWVWNFLYRHNLTDVYPCYKLMLLMLKLKKKGKVFVEVPIH